MEHKNRCNYEIVALTAVTGICIVFLTSGNDP